jgi:hypothetical protein
MNYWVFKITPIGNSLNLYANLLKVDFHIGEDNDAMPLNYLLSSNHFNNKDNPQEVYNDAKFIVKLLNGCSNLIYENNDDLFEIRLGELRNNGEKINGQYQIEKIDYLKLKDFPDLEGAKELKGVGSLVNKGLKKGIIRNILLFSSEGISYFNLYKIMEQIRIFLKNNNDTIENYVDKKLYNNFTHTANNFEASGLEARHPDKNELAPKIPLTLKKADIFIKELVSQVVLKYFSIEMPLIKSNNFDMNSIFDF